MVVCERRGSDRDGGGLSRLDRGVVSARAGKGRSNADLRMMSVAETGWRLQLQFNGMRMMMEGEKK